MLEINNTLLDQVVDIAYGAAQKILSVYHGSDYDVKVKADESPLTVADMASHRHIVDSLSSLTPEIPILSEESENVAFKERSCWRQYWLVDPLDGTKEFIAKNPEFTVNIALIEDDRPVLGVVLVPPTAKCYAGGEGLGAKVRIDPGAHWTPIKARGFTEAGPAVKGETFTIVASRRHGQAQLRDLLGRLTDQFGCFEVKNIGSALKICLCAEGVADLYPRLGPTCEWDTAAAQAILEAAGGAIIDASGLPLRYNTKETLLNPHFFAVGDATFAWSNYILE